MNFKDSALKRSLKLLFKPADQQCVLLEPHLGLGDSLINIGLVRALSHRHPKKKFYYAVRFSYFHSIAWMFQDLFNVFPLAIAGEREARQFASFLNIDYWPIGIDNVDIEKFDASFYRQHQVSFEERWSNCFVAPGPLAEILYQQLNPKDEPYILLCTTDSAGIRYELQCNNPRGLKVIEVYPASNNIYDWTKLVFKASQIHTIDTAFIHLVENILSKDTDKQLYFHRARKSATEFSRRLPWVVY
jgi:hypothetical protein